MSWPVGKIGAELTPEEIAQLVSTMSVAEPDQPMVLAPKPTAATPTRAVRFIRSPAPEPEKKQRSLKPGEQYIGRDKPFGRAAQRRLRQMGLTFRSRSVKRPEPPDSLPDSEGLEEKP